MDLIKSDHDNPQKSNYKKSFSATLNTEQTS